MNNKWVVKGSVGTRELGPVEVMGHTSLEAIEAAFDELGLEGKAPRKEPYTFSIERAPLSAQQKALKAAEKALDEATEAVARLRQAVSA